jgi:putative redox protein
MIQLKRKSGLAVEASSEKHSILIDVSEALGGTDLAMDPHQLLESALAACTSITVQMYANRKQWPLEGADVEVSFVSEGFATVLSRKITLRGNLDAEQKARLIEIADKCPIHRVLTQPTTIQTTLNNPS